MSKALKIVLIFVISLIILFTAVLIGLSATEYSPADVMVADLISSGADTFTGENSFTVLTYNTGYAALGDNADFFMDGGKMVMTSDKTRIEKNMAHISETILTSDADFVFLQEVDISSRRSCSINQYEEYASLFRNSVFAENFKVSFLPYPIPFIGKVDSGIATLSDYAIEYANRVSLPSSFKWPVSTVNLKRCALVSYIPIDGSDKQLVLVNFHLEAYDDGAGKLAQTEMLLKLIETEYEKGNYVIAGGDFNQTLPGGYHAYPITDTKNWVPGTFDADALPDGWQIACDSSTPTCRSLAKVYKSGEEHQFFLIDGFILSPNLELVRTETLSLNFESSDHNPVLAEFKFN